MIGQPYGTGGEGNLSGLFMRSQRKRENRHVAMRPAVHRKIMREKKLSHNMICFWALYLADSLSL